MTLLAVLKAIELSAGIIPLRMSVFQLTVEEFRDGVGTRGSGEG